MNSGEGVPSSRGGILCTHGPWIVQCTSMHKHAQLCTIMHNYARLGTIMHKYAQLCTIRHDYARLWGCISTKRQGVCKQEGSWGCDPPKTGNTAKSLTVTHVQSVQKRPSISPLHISVIVVRRVLFGSERRYLLSMYPARRNERSTSADVTKTLIRNSAHLAKVPDCLFQKLVSAVGSAIHGSTTREYVYH